jgi:hypothetical protein
MKKRVITICVLSVLLMAATGDALAAFLNPKLCKPRRSCCADIQRSPFVPASNIRCALGCGEDRSNSAVSVSVVFNLTAHTPITGANGNDSFTPQVLTVQNYRASDQPLNRPVLTRIALLRI